MNGSHAPELTDLLKEITEEIAKYVIKEGQPIILIDEYSSLLVRLRFAGGSIQKTLNENWQDRLKTVKNK